MEAMGYAAGRICHVHMCMHDGLACVHAGMEYAMKFGDAYLFMLHGHANFLGFRLSGQRVYRINVRAK